MQVNWRTCRGDWNHASNLHGDEEGNKAAGGGVQLLLIHLLRIAAGGAVAKHVLQGSLLLRSGSRRGTMTRDSLTVRA